MQPFVPGQFERPPRLFVDFGGTPRDFAFDLMFFAILIGSIYLHELGHAWGCLIQGVPVRRVMIYGGGGFCEPTRSSTRYEQELIVAMGPIVNLLENEFHDAWAHAGIFGDLGYLVHKLKPNPDQDDSDGRPMRVLLTKAGDAEIFRAQRAAIRNAQQYIVIQNAYFADDTMLYELARARRRGVDVRIIMPLVGNHGPMNRSNALAANAMLEHGIRVFLYPGMSHVKAAIFDGWASVGSANWDNLSFHTNKELNIATSDPEFVGQLHEHLFDVDLAQSVELTEPFPERWSDHLMEVVADYLL